MVIASFSFFITTSIFADKPEKVVDSMQVCETPKLCKSLAESLQTQIDALETKGLEKLTDAEFEQYFLLLDNLLAAQKAQTAHNEKLIAAEQKTQEEQAKVIEAERKKQESMRLAQEKELSKLKSTLLKE